MNEPLVQTVKDNTYLNPQVDHTVTTPKQLKSLSADFENYFKKIDDQSAPAEPATQDPPATEEPPKETPAEQEPKPEDKKEPEPKKAKSQPSAKAKSPKEEVKEEPPAPQSTAEPPLPSAPEAAKTEATGDKVAPVDPESLELPATSSPQQKSQFRELKDILKSTKKDLENARNESKMFRDTLGPLLKEVGIDLAADSDSLVRSLADGATKLRDLKGASLTPEVKTELEQLRAMQRAVDVLHSPEFIKKYSEPRDALYHDILDDMARFFDAPQADVEQFLTMMKTQYKPAQLNSQWWEQQLGTGNPNDGDKANGRIPKAFSPDRRRLEEKVARLSQLQLDHDKKAAEVASDQTGYQKWVAKQNEEAAAAYVNQIRSAVESHFAGPKKHIADWRPKPTEGVKDPVELDKIAKHNARFDRLQQQFTDFISTFNQGPSAAALRTLDYIEAAEKVRALEESLEEKETSLEEQVEANAELAQKLKAMEQEVDKRRKMADTPMKSGVGNGKPAPVKQKAPVDGMKSLQDAWKNYGPGS